MVEKKKTPTKVKQRKNRLTGEELGPVSQGAILFVLKLF